MSVLTVINRLAAVVAIALSVNAYMTCFAHRYLINSLQSAPEADAALVLGALVRNGDRPSLILQDRLTAALRLYRSGKVKKILVSGDHGRREYDEANAMRTYLLKHGVPGRDIFLDHAGFSTYDSIVRAKKIFLVRKLIITTQRYHLSRAVYIARKNGILAFGYPSDFRIYGGIVKFEAREEMARIKDFINVLLGVRPKYLGPQIPISGNGQQTWDRR